LTHTDNFREEISFHITAKPNLIMKNTILFHFILISIASYSQAVYTRPISRFPIKWNQDIKEYDRDTTKNTFKTKGPKIILSFEEIKIIDGDTTLIFLNETPEMEEDSVSIDRKWYDANDSEGKECFVLLFYYKKLNNYGLRIVYTDTDEGVEYYLNPLIVDIIPYKKDE